MGFPDHVADSTDWHSTSLPGFAAVEAALRCQVCKDLFKTPMITSCSHTFCSLCIRRALSNDGKCPACRSTEQEIKLRSNWALEETVEAFAKAREAALDLARNALCSSRSPKRAANENDVEDDGFAPPEAKRVRFSARLRSRGQDGSASGAALQQMMDGEEQANGGSSFGHIQDDEIIDSSYEPKSDGLVACPVCAKRMKDWQVFSHLEKCPGPPGNQKPENHNAANAMMSGGTCGGLSGRPPNAGLNQAQRRQQTKYERLPMLNYTMLKEPALRKKMSELGIASTGPRTLMERRHKEWTTLWNSNCDSATPKTRFQLQQDLDTWERTLGSRASAAGRTAQNAPMIKDKDFDGMAWAAKHSDSFQDLIASARRTTLEAKQGKRAQKEKEEEEEEGKRGEEEEGSKDADVGGSDQDSAAAAATATIAIPDTPSNLNSTPSATAGPSRAVTPHERGISESPARQPNGWQNTDYSLASQRS